MDALSFSSLESEGERTEATSVHMSDIQAVNRAFLACLKRVCRLAVGVEAGRSFHIERMHDYDYD